MELVCFGQKAIHRPSCLIDLLNLCLAKFIVIIKCGTKIYIFINNFYYIIFKFENWDFSYFSARKYNYFSFTSINM